MLRCEKPCSHFLTITPRKRFFRYANTAVWPLILAALVLGGCRKAGPPYSVDDALKTFKIEAGFHVEKFLFEPDVESPVAMDIDENGRIYVVEDRGYPLSTD